VRTREHRIYLAGTLLIAGVVAGAAIAQAIREHSLEPIWSVGWLPAVLVATLGTRRRCVRRSDHQARS